MRPVAKNTRSTAMAARHRVRGCTPFLSNITDSCWVKGSSGTTVPEQQHVFHDQERRRHGDQIAADDVVVEEAVVREHERQHGAGDARVAGRSQTMLEKSLVHESGEKTHFFLSSEKRSSVAHLNTRANVRASGRLGTYRSFSTELML